MDKPIPMILFCPACGVKHIDKPDPPCEDEGCPHSHIVHSHAGDWDNPPHKSHLCAHCGYQWRPADVFTVGVASLETAGKNDSHPLAHAVPVNQPGVRTVSDEDRRATQEFTIFNTLVSHCGPGLTPELIDKINRDIVREMRDGGTSWAFK